ncbi:MAG: SEL1-like repeat protein [Lentisphaeria bacterium]|nr:SEL1-like repeat protein [Lentisphaeria bacterium]
MKYSFSFILLFAVFVLHGAKTADSLRQKALAGDLPAMIALGDEYFRGVNRPRNFSLAAFWYRKGALAGSQLGNYRLGACLEFGWGIEKNPRLAFEYYKKALSLEAAQLRVAELFLKGLPAAEELPGVKADKEKAVNILRQLCKKNYYPAFMRLAEILYEDKTTRKSCAGEIYQLVLRSANTQNQPPQVLIFQAKLLQEGIGVKQNAVYARALLEIAARSGNPEAEFLFADALEFGRGTPANQKKAFEFYSRSAKSSFPAALVRMGDFCLEGTFLPHDPQKAVKYFQKAAEKKYAPALRKLGWCSENGIGVKKDPAQAFNFYEQSANSGDPLGTYHAGRCFLDGIGVNADPAGAFYYFKRSAAQGCREGMLALAECYRTGRGCTPDLSLSQRLQQEAEKL